MEVLTWLKFEKFMLLMQEAVVTRLSRADNAVHPHHCNLSSTHRLDMHASRTLLQDRSILACARRCQRKKHHLL